MHARFLRVLCLSMIVIVSAANSAVVSIVSDGAHSTEQLGTFTGSLNYTFTNASTAQLSVSLTNTSPLANGGKITAFAFNLPGGITAVTLSTLTNLDHLLGSPTFSSSIAAPPFDALDVGASLSNDWLGGGNPNPGIAVGATGQFTFDLSGTGLDLLTTQSFVNSINPDGEFFLVRYRGFVNEGSDKVPTNVVPEASSVLCVGLMAGALGILARRKRAR